MTSSLSADINGTTRALQNGDMRRCARLITQIERGEREIVPLLQQLHKAGGKARTIGITGPPGAGKSTLVSQLVRELRRKDRRVAVLAIDPSSPFSGGAVLGDRLRMSEHGTDSGVFIRSMASRGQLGGLALAAGDALTVLCTMPWDFVIIETVGVGQNETDIMRHAETVVLLQTPMGGDGIQAAKAGIIEIADILVVNKCDHPQADQTARQLAEMVMLGARLHGDYSWVPPVVKTQSLSGEGIAELIDHIDRRFAHLAANPELAIRRERERLRFRTSEILQDMLKHRMHSNKDDSIDRLMDDIITRKCDPYEVAAIMLERL